MINKSIFRTLAHNPNTKLELSEVRKSSKEQEEDKDGNPLKVVVETEAARKAREKAEWQKLSFIERLVNRFLPSQVNSIVIFVNYILFVFTSLQQTPSSISGCSWFWLCPL